jgi:hypothetical protein
MGKILRIKNLKKKNVWDSVESNEPLQGIISKKKKKNTGAATRQNKMMSI